MKKNHLVTIHLKIEKKCNFYPIFQVLICKLEAFFAWLPHINTTHMTCLSLNFTSQQHFEKFVRKGLSHAIYLKRILDLFYSCQPIIEALHLGGRNWLSIPFKIDPSFPGSLNFFLAVPQINFRCSPDIFSIHH